MSFTLHPQLAQDTLVMGDLTLCRLLLAKDGNYPWFILVPRVENITEFHQLNDQQQAQYLVESNILSLYIKNTLNADKINIAALGNMVPQLHIHHVARFKKDLAWPNPIWGHAPATPRDKAEELQLRSSVLAALKSLIIV